MTWFNKEYDTNTFVMYYMKNITHYLSIHFVSEF